MLPLIAYVGRIFFIIITTITFSIAIATFSRHRTVKSLLITIGFTLLFVHGIISIPELLNVTYNRDFTDGLHLLIDGTAVLFLLLGTLKE